MHYARLKFMWTCWTRTVGVVANHIICKVSVLKVQCRLSATRGRTILLMIRVCMWNLNHTLYLEGWESTTRKEWRYMRTVRLMGYCLPTVTVEGLFYWDPSSPSHPRVCRSPLSSSLLRHVPGSTRSQCVSQFLLRQCTMGGCTASFCHWRAPWVWSLKATKWELSEPLIYGSLIVFNEENCIQKP